jgi:predicted transcriptional regulator of viral defense system
LNFHGLTTQLPVRIEVMATRTYSLENVDLIRSPFPWGYRKHRYGDFDIFVADVEKVVIDALYTGRLPEDEIYGAITDCDPGRLEEYVLRTDRSSLIKLAGYFAETGGVILQDAYERIRSDRNYVEYPARIKTNRWRVKGK